MRATEFINKQQGVAENSLDEGVNDPHIFKAIAMIGPMGAGKSTIARQLVGGSGLRSLNLDNFNELLIKQGKVVGGNLTPDQLERNWQLTQKQKGNWVSERLGLLIDGSGRNIEGLVKPLNELEQLGYDTMIILVNVSLETSIQRQQSRAAQQAAQFGQGRNVPLDLAKSSYQQIQQNIPKLKQLYGNRLLVINNEGAVDLSQEKTIVDRFMAAPPSKPAAVAWIKAHSQSQGQKIDKQLAQQQRRQVSAQRAQTQQGVSEGISNAVIFFRGEPILSQERLNQLKSSIGKPYPILRKEGSAKNIGTYMTNEKIAKGYITVALAGQGKGGAVTKIAVDLKSFQSGDGGIDEAVIITNIAGLVSDQTPNKNDPLRIQDRKKAMLKYLGPGVKKYLNDPLLSDPKIVQSWYNPEFAQQIWNTIKSGKRAETKPGESNILERMKRILGPLAEKIRRDPEVISYFIAHKPNDWVEYNFRMNSDGSGTKVLDVKYYPPAKQGVAEGKIVHTYLWHGSRQKITMLEPRQAVDTGGAAGSNQNAIYATADPKIAIAMGMPTADSDYGHFPNDPQMVLFSGKIRKDEYVYLHKLPFNGPDGKPQFVQGGHSREFHSIPKVQGIKPIKIKKIPVNKYLNLVRKATPADLKLRKKYMKKKGVAEGSDAEAYKEKLLTTLPQIMRFFEKNGKGWKPSKEQMLAAVETGYTVMKHTGDVKQAGKAMMDELNTLHRMGQDNQDVAEGLNEFATGSGGGGKDDILKTLAAQWLNGDVSSGDLDSDIQSQEKVERRLARGIICPDGVKRKLYIDYSDDYKGVVIYSDDNWSITYKQDDLTESKQGVAEAWSEKYKKSINCKNPKGFSQRAHCQGRKKK